MVRRLGLSRLAAAVAFGPLAAVLAIACGGSDIVDAADSGADARARDGGGDAQNDATLSDGGSDASDGSDSGSNDSSAGDTSVADTGGADADAGRPDADAGARDGDAGAVAEAGQDAEAGLDAEAGPGPDAGDAGSGILGSASRFAVLAGSTITITPPPPVTTIVGDVGVFPGTAIVTLPPGQPIGAVHAGDPVAGQAQTDLTTAYNTLAGMACLPANNETGVDLGGKTLAPGVYCFNSSAGITGNLVLDAQLNPNAVWVIQVASTLTTATGATVSVINGGSACNVYWQIGSSATLGTGTKLVGSVVALSSISLVTGSTVIPGRTLARNGAVALDANSISAAGCQ